jgi:hypothetical protein
MANVYGSAVAFTKEKNVWTLSAQLQFGPSGAVTLNTSNSKGFCAAWNESVAFTGGTTDSSSSLGTVSSFAGVFRGMSLAGANIQAGTTVGSFTAAGGIITLAGPLPTASGTAEGTFQATGGRYRLQLGTVAGQNLTPFVKVLGVNVTYDCSTGSSSGAANYMQRAPAAPVVFVVQNKVSIRTVPPTAATNSTDASIAIQFGYGVGPGTGFVAQPPSDGETVRVDFILGNSTGP